MKFWILISTTILFAIGCQSSIAYKDFKNDDLFPAFNEEFIFTINGDSVAGYAFIAMGENPKETIILVHGFPGNDNNFDVAHALRRTGKNVIHFNYRGAWGNQGKYLYSNGLKDVDFMIDYLTTPENSKRLRILKDNFTLLGRSYGGGIALIQGGLNDHVKNIIAISSVNYGEIMKRYKQLDELGGFKRYMKKQFMINTNINAFLQEMLDNKSEFNVLTYKEKLERKNVLIIEDSDKNDHWVNQIENCKIVKLETDHGFIDKRIEMTNTIVNWLKSIE